MRRILILLMLLIGVTALMMFTGCGDDDDGGTNSNATINPIDSAFITDFFDDSQWLEVLYSVDMSMALLEAMGEVDLSEKTMPRMALVEGELIIIDAISFYNYSNGWHIMDFEAMIIDEDTVDVSGRDSVKVMQDGSVIEFPWEIEHIDEIHVRVHVQWDVRNEIGFGALHHSVSAAENVVGLDTTYTINGAVHDTTSANDSWEEGGSCSIDLTLNQTITALTMPGGDQGDDCPLSGAISMDVGIDAGCMNATDTVSVVGNWTLTATVLADQRIRVTFSNGQVSWSTIEVCYDGAPRAPWAVNRY